MLKEVHTLNFFIPHTYIHTPTIELYKLILITPKCVLFPILSLDFVTRWELLKYQINPFILYLCFIFYWISHFLVRYPISWLHDIDNSRHTALSSSLVLEPKVRQTTLPLNTNPLLPPTSPFSFLSETTPTTITPADTNPSRPPYKLYRHRRRIKKTLGIWPDFYFR